MWYIYSVIKFTDWQKLQLPAVPIDLNTDEFGVISLTLLQGLYPTIFVDGVMLPIGGNGDSTKIDGVWGAYIDANTDMIMLGRHKEVAI